ncbi:MAG: dihydrolipoyl dehydrogenase [Paludibacteraceae bacterium]|nr:dihydrolipoyl dehydrogenase [Paludibacteraceae bacterium]
MYYLAIIGGGPAGYTAAELAKKAGKEVVLFEQTALGGTCLNVGCIPTKSLLYGAKQYYNATHAQRYGVTAENASYDFAAMQKRKTIVVRKLVAGIRQRLQGVTVVNGAATVISRTDECVSIACGEQIYEAENLLICTGSSNFVPPIPGIQNNPAVWNSTDALNASELPKSVIIVGGGVIGMEFATLYSALGIPVTIIEALPRILSTLDESISDYLTAAYTKRGVNILTSTKVEAIEGQRLMANGEWYEADKILVCVGRRANIQGLEALTDLEYNRGAIVVDDFMRTNLPNVYAAGDVTGKIMLAHVASRQAEVAVGRMLKQIPVQRIAYNAIPSVVYTYPEVASVGISENALEGCEAVQLPMTYSGRFVAENEGETGMCKLVVNTKSQTIMGVHLVGNPSSEFIAATSFAVRMGYTLPEFRQVVFPHPTVSEILRETVNEIQ